jgi:hypothetical protein
MKLFRAISLFFAFILVISLGASLRFSVVSAQPQGEPAQESVLPLQITANDEISSANVSAHHLHLRSLRSASRHAPLENSEVNREMVAKHSHSASTFSGPTIPTVPSPGFYPADLSNSEGEVLVAAQSNNVYINCAPSCWGTPSTFLTHLGLSNFIHVTDEYVHATAGARYTVGAATSITAPAPKAPLSPTDILTYVHSAARAHGSGYGHVYHIFLRPGVDICVSANVCYSPDNMTTFFFCAYHGSVDFPDLGHVLYTVQPFQNVPLCAVMQPSPNGAIVDSTASALSHELIETITDPDGDAWFAQSSLIEYGQEIADICETPFGEYAPVSIQRKLYAIQPEYANKYHACATAF